MRCSWLHAKHFTDSYVSFLLAETSSARQPCTLRPVVGQWRTLPDAGDDQLRNLNPGVEFAKGRGSAGIRFAN
jgi:hypothetical protein